MTESRVAMCHRHFRERKVRIERQADLIQRLRSAGRDIVLAEQILLNFGELQRMTLVHLEQLQHRGDDGSTEPTPQAPAPPVNKSRQATASRSNEHSRALRNMPDRVRILVAFFDLATFRRPPKNVGLKTMIAARDAGLIEVSSDLRKPLGRLTKAGLKWREHNDALEKKRAAES